MSSIIPCFIFKLFQQQHEGQLAKDGVREVNQRLTAPRQGMDKKLCHWSWTKMAGFGGWGWATWVAATV